MESKTIKEIMSEYNNIKEELNNRTLITYCIEYKVEFTTSFILFALDLKYGKEIKNKYLSAVDPVVIISWILLGNQIANKKYKESEITIVSTSKTLLEILNNCGYIPERNDNLLRQIVDYARGKNFTINYDRGEKLLPRFGDYRMID